MKKTLTLIHIIVCLLSTHWVKANDLTIENVKYDIQAKALTFDISWSNSWYLNPDFHDGVWVFAKYKAANSSQWKHVDFTGATAEANIMIIRNDGNGFIMYTPVISLSGMPFDLAPRTVTISNIQPLTPGGMPELNPSFKVFGVEMVYIPEGNFYAGDVESDNTIKMRSNNTPMLIRRGSNMVPYKDEDNNVTGISNFSPDSYPNGYGDFYIMKYEVTQGMYMEFLNTLNKAQQQAMTNHNIDGGADYSQYAMNPYSTSNFYVATESFYQIYDFTHIVGPEVPAEYPLTYSVDYNTNDAPDSAGDGQGKAAIMLTPSQLINFLDWAALRPMTELQYEKAARGFDQPVPGEYAWGTINSVSVLNIVNDGTPAEVAGNTGEGLSNFEFTPMRVGFAATETTDRLMSGASYFGVMNLSDNALELTMPMRAGAEPELFRTLGDGMILADASLTNELNQNSVRYKGGAILELKVSVSDRSEIFIVDMGFNQSPLDLPNYIWVRMGGRGVR